ncbi:hypothetical protein ACFY1P_08000 [Streptomyces sp. NPDC001407]|uniref:hypothetical protein n=1 Tax=Streptomyces sp. NPDC001407 TaxID=3364573 RepID=UPI00367A432B
MSYTDLRDFHCEYRETFDGERDGKHATFTVEIEKLGGGTVGKKYAQESWRYIAKHSDGEEIARGQDLYMGSPATHEDAAKCVFEMACDTEEIRGY